MKTPLSKILLILLFHAIFSTSSAQKASSNKDMGLIYHNAKEFTLIGKGNPTPSNHYHRVDTATYTTLPQRTKYLLTNSTGLTIAFKTNSTKIRCKWTLSNYNIGNNMTLILQSGLDLYAKENNQWINAGVGRPTGINSAHTLVENMDGKEREFLLYLPAYNTLEDLEIGVDEGATISSIPNPFKKRIVVYGSSITQGASASRPGLVYTSKIGRNMNVEFVNLGVSGRGVMEKEAARMTADIDANIYVLDCAANPSPAQITERTNYLVKHIRERHPNTPIVMIQSVVREMGNFDLVVRERVKNQNINFATEYQKLIDEGIKDLYLIEGKDLLGHDHEGEVDGIHPTDVGFLRMIDIIQPRLEEILNK